MAANKIIGDKMGCSHHADKDGIFEIVITKYECYGKDSELEHIRLIDLEPYGKINIGIIHGNER